MAAHEQGPAASLPGIFRVAILPRAKESVERFTALLNALAARVGGIELLTSQLPFDEALAKFVARELDFAVPCLWRRDLEQQPFTLSKASISKSFQVLYSNNAKPLGEMLENYELEADPRNMNFFEFPVKASASVESSLRKVAEGKIDGFINAEGSADPVLRALGYRNIHRKLLRTAEGFAILPKGAAGKSADQFLSTAVELCKDDPIFLMMQKRPYGEWQP